MPRPDRRGFRTEAAAGLLLAVLLIQSLGTVVLHSATSDEVTHLPSGYVQWKSGRPLLNPQHPPLVKLLAALPLLAVSTPYPFEPARAAEPFYEWQFGPQFLYGPGSDADRLLLLGRLPIVGLTLLLGLYVFLWAREISGDLGGLLALALYALCPTVVAHGQLVTMDMGLSCFATAALYHLRKGLDGGPHVLLAGLCAGAALASKFSAVFYLPAFATAVALVAWRGRISWPRAGSVLATVGASAFLVVWASYFFRDPRRYVEGLLRVNADHAPGFQNYLFGMFTSDHLWSYFPIAFLAKTPVPILLAVAAAAVLAIRRRRSPDPLEEAFLLLPAACFTLATMALANPMGVRYLLPVHPLLFIFAGRTACLLTGSRPRLAAGGALALWLAVSAVRIWPDHLSYFNELVGGPGNGWKILDDSNIDWGQDLKRVRPWMEENGVPEIRLAYAWTARPEYYGIRATPVHVNDWRYTPSPGVYVISTQMLIRGRLEAREKGWKTDWLDRYTPADRIGYSLYVFRF